MSLIKLFILLTFVLLSNQNNLKSLRDSSEDNVSNLKYQISELLLLANSCTELTDENYKILYNEIALIKSQLETFCKKCTKNPQFILDSDIHLSKNITGTYVSLPDKSVALGTVDGYVQIYSQDLSKIIYEYKAHDGSATEVFFNKKYIISVGADSKLAIMNIETQKDLIKIPIEVADVHLSYLNEDIFVVSSRGYLRFYSISNEIEITKLVTKLPGVHADSSSGSILRFKDKLIFNSYSANDNSILGIIDFSQKPFKVIWSIEVKFVSKIFFLNTNTIAVAGSTEITMPAYSHSYLEVYNIEEDGSKLNLIKRIVYGNKSIDSAIYLCNENQLAITFGSSVVIFDVEEGIVVNTVSLGYCGSLYKRSVSDYIGLKFNDQNHLSLKLKQINID